MNHFPLASSQGQALLGFFPKAILFPQSQINDDKVLILKCSFFLKDKDFMAFFYGWGSTASRLEPLWGGSLLFTIKFP